MTSTLIRRVRARAEERCEYCLIPAAASEFTFPIDHVIARQHGGDTVMANLALACPHCNYYKGPNLAGLDPATGCLTRLFHPRRNRWKAHFAWDGPILQGRTPIGRTTIRVLFINHPDRVEARRLLGDIGQLPWD